MEEHNSTNSSFLDETNDRENRHFNPFDWEDVVDRT
jgi:hypothetical protein